MVVGFTPEPSERRWEEKMFVPVGLQIQSFGSPDHSHRLCYPGIILFTLVYNAIVISEIYQSLFS
jgi:hypothetical protein